ncbi:hypothetical protein J6590_076698 [Homalodisca vitripennis]|nr:hypothetical protein J6590_076698 [Homalodisca vitripennis]
MRPSSPLYSRFRNEKHHLGSAIRHSAHVSISGTCPEVFHVSAWHVPPIVPATRTVLSTSMINAYFRQLAHSTRPRRLSSTQHNTSSFDCESKHLWNEDVLLLSSTSSYSCRNAMIMKSRV